MAYPHHGSSTDQREHAADDGAWHCPRSDILAAAGATGISTSRTALNSPGHLLGTARMGNDSERSVVNAWGRSHDVGICSSSMAASGSRPVA